MKSRNGFAANGITATQSDAASTMKPRRRGSGLLSARRPPSQYPSASAPRTIPIRLAHTIVEEPKYGARSRDAVISVASAPIPAPKTSAASARLPGRSPGGSVIYRPKTRSISPSVRVAITPVTMTTSASTSQNRTPAQRFSR